jgi:hypothetical protein
MPSGTTVCDAFGITGVVALDAEGHPVCHQPASNATGTDAADSLKSWCYADSSHTPLCQHTQFP